MPNYPSHPLLARMERKFLRNCGRGVGSVGSNRVSVGPYTESIPKLDCSQSRDGSELHGKHFATGCHPRRRFLVVHEVCGAFDLGNRFIGSDGMMAVLEVKAEGEVNGMLEKGVANRSIDNING